MVNIPEHHFTDDQIAKLIKLLGVHPDKLPKIKGEGLADAGRWFTSSLVMQNYPPSSQIDKSLERIESAASRLRVNLLNEFATPYMRQAAGDIFEDDNKLNTAIVAVENLKRWSQEAREIVKRNEESVRRNEAEREAVGKAVVEANARGGRKATPEAIASAKAKAKAKNKAKGKPKGHPKHTAKRVLIHRLALLWLRTNGIPTVSVNRDGHASGKFIRFAQGYISAMNEQTTDEHRRHAKYIDKELLKGVCADKCADTIAWHLKFFLARLTPRP